MPMSPIPYSDYKSYFKEFLNTSGARGSIGRLAEVLDCDRTYVSQFLNGKADLRPDHIARFCDEYGLKGTEADYLMTLLLKDKADKPKAKAYFERKLDELITEHTQLTKKFATKKSSTQLSEEDKATYFSDFNFMVIHILTSIEGFQTVSALTKKLSMPETEISKILQFLVRTQLVEQKLDLFKHSGENVYIPRTSPFVQTMHFNARYFAARRSNQIEDVHLTNVFSLSQSDFKKLKIKLTQVIDEMKTQIELSPSEEVGVFCCDFLMI